MLDSGLEPSYNLPKNLLLLPWILKLLVDMVNDSTSLVREFWNWTKKFHSLVLWVFHHYRPLVADLGIEEHLVLMQLKENVENVGNVCDVILRLNCKTVPHFRRFSTHFNNHIFFFLILLIIAIEIKNPRKYVILYFSWS